MKYIIKNEEPKEFKDWKLLVVEDRLNHHSTSSGSVIWNILQSTKSKELIEGDYSKSELRDALLNEQGFMVLKCQIHLIILGKKYNLDKTKFYITRIIEEHCMRWSINNLDLKEV